VIKLETAARIPARGWSWTSNPSTIIQAAFSILIPSGVTAFRSSITTLL